MTLGNRIQQLRKEHNMSQGDLADALDISRQSVSKWETDTATPDLDKLLKLSEIFNVTLDALVKGEAPSPNEAQTPLAAPEMQPVPVTIKTGLETRQFAGIILLCMAFIVVLVCTIMGGLLAGILFASPFLVCGLICMFIKEHVGIYCGWAINIMVIIYLQLATGSNYAMVLNPYVYSFANPIAIIVSWVHFLLIVLLIYCTIRAFGHTPIVWNKHKQTLLIIGWVVYVIIHFPTVLISNGVNLKLMIALSYVGLALGIIRMILLTALIIFTLSWYKWNKEKTE